LANLVVGICGPIGSGKGIVTDWFKDHGFLTISLSDEIRVELQNLNRDITRESLQEVGNDLREKLGDSVLAERVWSKVGKVEDSRIVIESIRHPAEATYLKEQSNFYLLNVTADQKVRYERVAKRHRSGDSLTWEDFLREDTEESMGHHGDHSQLVNETAKLADFVVDNNGPLANTYIQLAVIMGKISKDA
jgi:dephospho-CoA kinase